MRYFLFTATSLAVAALVAAQLVADIGRINALEAEATAPPRVITKYDAWNEIYGAPPPRPAVVADLRLPR